MKIVAFILALLVILVLLARVSPDAVNRVVELLSVLGQVMGR